MRASAGAACCPRTAFWTGEDASDETRQKLQDSLVLVHGGMAQNVGPILEMVTEKYLLRSQPEWTARQEAQQVLDDILADLQHGRHRGARRERPRATSSARSRRSFPGPATSTRRP